MVLLCWHTTSEDVGEIGIEIELFHKYAAEFYYCATDSSRGAVLKNGIWHKNGTHWYSLELAESLWRSNSETVNSTFQKWWQWLERQATFWTAMQIFMSTAGELFLVYIANAGAVLKNSVL